MENGLNVMVSIRPFVQDQESEVDLGVGRKHGLGTSEMRDNIKPIYNKDETLKSPEVEGQEAGEDTGKDEHRDTEDTEVHRERFYGWKRQKQRLTRPKPEAI